MNNEKKMFKRIEDILNCLGDMELNHKKGKVFTFNFILTDKMEAADIGALDLSERASNCLRRARISTVGELVNYAQHSNDLKKIRNCGSTSAAEIMEKLFIYNLLSLRPEKREQFLRETIEKNIS